MNSCNLLEAISELCKSALCEIEDTVAFHGRARPVVVPAARLTLELHLRAFSTPSKPAIWSLSPYNR